MLRDNRSDYTWLFAYFITNAFSPAAMIIEWCAALASPTAWRQTIQLALDKKQSVCCWKV